VAPILDGAQVLWVDDKPSWNVLERRALRSMGIFVDLARNTDEAIALLLEEQVPINSGRHFRLRLPFFRGSNTAEPSKTAGRPYDAIISNIKRTEPGRDETAGLYILGWLKETRPDLCGKAIFYISEYMIERNSILLPIDAFAITKQPDSLLHAVMDLLERGRSMRMDVQQRYDPHISGGAPQALARVGSADACRR